MTFPQRRFGWRSVPQGGVESCFAVHLLNELADAPMGLGKVVVLEPMDLLILQGLEEALGLSIVVGVARPAHADANPLGLDQVGTGLRGIRDPTIRVVDQPRLDEARGQGHLEHG
jgi:hypothetical protein